MRPYYIGLIALVLLLSACGQVLPTPTEPGQGSTPQDPIQQPQPTEPDAVFEPVDPDDVIVDPLQPGEGASDPKSWDPVPEDKNLKRGNVFVTATDLLILESFPPQYMLSLEGDLPTPCHMLRVKVGEPDVQNQIIVEAYSVYDPTVACIQVLSPFVVEIPLGSFVDAEYTVLLNGEKVGQIGE